MKRKCDGNEVGTLEFVDDEIENNNNCDIQKFVCVSDYLLEFTIDYYDFKRIYKVYDGFRDVDGIELS